MRILFVVPNVPSAIRPRPLHFIRGLSQMHQVAVVCLATNEADSHFVSELRQHCQSMEVIRLSRWRSLSNCLRALFSTNSLRCAYFYSPDLRKRVKALVEANEVDLIHAEHLKSLSMVKPSLGRVPVVLDAVDCLSMLESRRRAVTKNPLVKLFSWMESRKFALSEAKASRQFDRIAISSAVDRQAYPIPAGLREKIDVIPNGVDLEHFGFRQFEAQKNVLVFRFCAGREALSRTRLGGSVSDSYPRRNSKQNARGHGSRRATSRDIGLLSRVASRVGKAPSGCG